MAFWNSTPQQPAGAPGGAPQQPATLGATLVQGYQQLLMIKKQNPQIDLPAKLCDLIVEHAVKERASDIHIEGQGQNIRVRFRIDGIMHDMLAFKKDPNVPLMQRIRVLSGFDPEPSTSYKNEDGRFQKIVAGRPIQLRVSSFPTVNGEKLVLRVVDRGQLSVQLDKIGLEQDTLALLRKIIRNPYGIFFITGDTGSGKTTSLYSILQDINTPAINIITLEDPVEYRMDGINQAQISARTGFTWTEGLHTILRQDPNVIMVGEIRDYDTAEMSMRSALTGHLLFTTIHTINAPSIIERLFEMGIPQFLISSAMIGAMAQRLVRRVCPQCAQKSNPPSEAMVNGFIKSMDPEEGEIVKKMILAPGANYMVERGCPNCRNTGYRGRTGIFELMLMNEEIRRHVINHSPTDVIKRSAIKSGGMRTLLMDGILKARAGVTTLSEVIRLTSNIV